MAQLNDQEIETALDQKIKLSADPARPSQLDANDLSELLELIEET